MPKGYRPYFPDQDLLLPPSLRDWLPEDHLVYFVSDVVDQLDLSAIHAWYGEEKRGQPPYDPVLMTKLLVYGYCTGVFSSRRLQKRIQARKMIMMGSNREVMGCKLDKISTFDFA